VDERTGKAFQANSTKIALSGIALALSLLVCLGTSNPASQPKSTRSQLMRLLPLMQLLPVLIIFGSRIVQKIMQAPLIYLKLY
jgi:hypothetical protein